MAIETSDGAARAAAFFDLDRTLVAGSSGWAFARAAAKAGIITRRQLAALARDALRFRLHGSTDEHTDRMREEIAALIAGKRVRDLERLAPDIMAGVLPRVFPEALNLAYEHQDAGRPIVMITAASQEMADLLRPVLVFDHAIGFRSEIVDGRYTGRPAGPFTYREGKAEAIRQFAAEHRVDLAASYAYSDSESDLPMLRAVGHPVAVNPDRELAQVAQAEGWDVLHFDKLHTRMRVGGTVAVAALLGTLGSQAARQRQRKRGRR